MHCDVGIIVTTPAVVNFFTDNCFSYFRKFFGGRWQSFGGPALPSIEGFKDASDQQTFFFAIKTKRQAAKPWVKREFLMVILASENDIFI
jgi:hypothetical protein